MAGITSGIGLISGMNTDDIVRQLMAIERVPIKRLETRVQIETSRQTALSQLGANLLMLKTSIGQLKSPTFFKQVTTTSSNPNALTASVSSGVAPGTYQFRPVQTAAAQQAMSQGFASLSSTVGEGAIRLAPAAARIDGPASIETINGGAGFSRGAIRIMQGNGVAATVDLSTVQTLDDVVKAINSAESLSVAARIDGGRLTIDDLSGGTGELRISEVASGQTAAGLGILKTSVDGTIAGDVIHRMGAGTALASLNDGLGVRSRQGVVDLRIQAASVAIEIDMDAIATVGQFIDAVNGHADNDGTIQAAVSADGARIELTSTQGGAPTVTTLFESQAAADLGLLDGSTAGSTLTGSQVWAEYGSTLLKNLNGGSGVAEGSIRLTDRAGNIANVNLTGAESLQQVLDAINTSGIGITASVAGDGLSLLLRDTSGGAGAMMVENFGGTAATDLGIATAGVYSDTFKGSSIARQSMSEATALDKVGGGAGVHKGTFRIVDRTGAGAVVDIGHASVATIGDVIRAINTRGIGITARINDTGDGILLEDTSGGAGTMRVEDMGGGTSAADLRIKGQASADTPTIIDGSFTTTVEVAAGTTLQQVADALHASGAGVTASVVNVGGAMPYRLSVLSSQTGQAGALAIDAGSTALNFSVVQEGRDAMLLMGSGGAAVAMISSSNTFRDVVKGMDVTVTAPSAMPVTVSVASDTSKIAEQLQRIVSGYNDVIGKINEYTKYNAETEQRGLLMGDPAILTLERQLRNVVFQRFDHLGGPIRGLKDLGVSFGAAGKLEFDAETFNTALAANPDAVRQFFTAEAQTDGDGNTTQAGGFGAYLEGVIDRLTDSQDGTLTRRSNTFGTLVEQFNRRIKDLEARIVRKEVRVRKQFMAMEQTLSRLMEQSGAISNFPQFTPWTGNSRQ